MPKLCKFEPIPGENAWKCPVCKWIDRPHPNYPRTKPTKRICTPPKKITPPTPEQIAAQEAKRKRQENQAIEAGKKLGWKPEHAKRWAGALLNWRRAGYPTRTDEEVATIVAICESCNKYKADEGRCSVCGCKVSTSGMAVFNKARMGSENCPEGKWPTSCFDIGH